MTSRAEAEAFLRARFGSGVEAVEALAAGEWSQAFAVRLDGKEVVARFGRYPEDFAKDRLVGERAAGLLPVPRVLASGEAPGGAFVLSERAYGVMLDDLDAPTMRAVLPRLLGCLEAAQEMRFSRASGYGLFTPDGRAPDRSWPAYLLSVSEERPRTAGWRAAFARQPHLGRAFDAGVRALARAAPSLPNERGLVHGDLLNRNVLVEKARVSAILDWGNALWGDPLYDHAWLSHWWPWYPAWRGIDAARTIARWHGHGRAPEERWRVAVYRLHIALDSLAYSAFKGRGAESEAAARQVVARARRL